MLLRKNKKIKNTLVDFVFGTYNQIPSLSAPKRQL